MPYPSGTLRHVIGRWLCNHGYHHVTTQPGRDQTVRGWTITRYVTTCTRERCSYRDVTVDSRPNPAVLHALDVT